MNAAFLSLGGNTGNRMAHLSQATHEIVRRCGPVLKASSVYETAAWGVAQGQAYLNQVIKIETKLSAGGLLEALLDIEKQNGRIREGHQYSDRTIDLDILFYNDAIIHDRDLRVPHPRLHLRNFALVPLVEIEPDWIHPEIKKNMAELLRVCPDTLSVKTHDPLRP